MRQRVLVHVINHRWSFGVVAVACVLLSRPAFAEAPAESAPSALVIAAQTKPGSPLSEATEAVRSALEKISAVRLLPPSPLDLDAVQLAIDCPDESPRCLREIATRMEAQVVIVPAIKQRKDSLELRITCFRRDAHASPTTALRKQAGTELDATLLDAVPSMLREVLQIEDAPEEAPDAVSEETEPAQQPAPTDAPPQAAETSAQVDGSRSAFPLGPVVLGGGGAALVIAGVVVGAIASATEDEYASQEVATEAQAKAADRLRIDGENQALAANVLLGTGAAAIVAAGIWYWLDRPAESSAAQASVRPLLGPRSAGLVLTGHWESLP